MKVTLTTERLRELIPNVIHEVKGEIPLLDKLYPWLESAERWLIRNTLGADFNIPESMMSLVERIIVTKAFAEAIPSLDMALSPSGFAVINTDGRAPASKERIERLIAALNSSIDENVEELLQLLLADTDWIITPMGQWWTGTFIPSLSVVHRFRTVSNLLDTYRSMRSHATRFERELAELYIGDELLNNLRGQQFTTSENKEIIKLIQEAELRYVSFHMRDQKATCPDEHEVWHLIRPVIDRLKYFPELYQQWQSEMGGRFNPEPFKNDIKGGFYF